MADKNAVMRGLIGGILYDLMVKSNVYNISVDEDTNLGALLNEIVIALNGKVKSADIVDDLVTGGRGVPLSAEMGKELKALIDQIAEGTLLEETDPTVPDWAKAQEKPTYTTEEIPLTSDSNSPMLVNKLQEIVTALNGKYSANNPPPYPVRSVNGYGGDVKLTPGIIGAQPAGAYATEEFVERKISEAELGGEGVDLSKYALKTELPTKVSQLENDKEYLTEHQDISGLLPRGELDGAIDAALAQAKESGEFKGDPGYTPQKNIDYFDGKNGDPGKDGYNPVRGKDYWTDADIAVIKSYVDDAILGGTW
jgi:hypothetical protein